MFGAMVWMTVIHAILLFWWYMIDEQISGERTIEKQTAKRAAKQRDMERVGELLAGAEKLLKQKAALIAQYGASEVEIMLSSVAGIDVDLNGDGVAGYVPTAPMASTVGTMPEIVDAVNPTIGANSQQPPRNSQQPK
jgi:hypothetical protein